MLWYAELIIEAALIVRLALYRDGRPRFEALLWVDWMVQIVQIISERFNLHGLNARIWYVGVVVWMPLMFLAFQEAADFRPMRHRRLLFAWFSVAYALAWIRFFPYTGTALIVSNSVFFMVWLADSVRRNS